MHPVSSPSIHRQQHDVPRDATALPPTLETRKKKKKADLSSPLFKPLQDDRLEASITLQPRRSGSKRKFSPDEDGVWSEVASGDDEFQFSRPSGSPSKRAGTFGLTSQPLSPVKAAKSIDPEPVKPAITNRKVLEPSTCSLPGPFLITFQCVLTILRECKCESELSQQGASFCEIGPSFRSWFGKSRCE